MMIGIIIAAAMLVGGAFFALTAAVGLLRMPDFYSRIHPAGKCDTLAQFLILGGLLIFSLVGGDHADFAVAAKLLMIMFFLFITAPTATHAICKAAYLDGLNLWEKPGDRQGTRVLQLSLRAIIPRVSWRTKSLLAADSSAESNSTASPAEPPASVNSPTDPTDATPNDEPKGGRHA